MSIGLRRGIIEEIVSKYEYKVRIVNYDSAIGDPTKVITANLATATVLSFPGIEVSYNEGDRVIVGFNKDELTDPIILGAMVTPEFPTSWDQTSYPYMEYLVDNMQNSLDKLLAGSFYTHIKYSNDNGVTLTSLYNYSKVKDTQDIAGQINVLKDSDIKIDSDSSTIYWSIIDNNNKDVTNDINITTILNAVGPSDESLKDDNGKLITSLKEVFTTNVIEIPTRLKNFKELFLSFQIVNVPGLTDLNKYHIVLTTDKQEIGSVLGDWLGICISDDPTPPEDPSRYSWTSFNDSIENFINALVSNVEPRLSTVENILFDNSNNSQSKNGLADNISIYKNQIDIHGVDNKDISFNTNKSIFIDNINNNFTTEELRHSSNSNSTEFIEQYRENGHFTLFIRSK